tara:strand:+ start:51 stop:800 length:750 start_codon:yes stop_codon:yes gene_type:complete
MVDTLAPKKIFTQRELDKSLTPSPVTAAIMQPDKNLVDLAPDQKMPADLIGQQSDFLVDPNSIMAGMQENQAPGTMEREQTIRSSEETTADKQTGERARRDTTQGLASRPGVMYAAEGVDKMEIDRPMVVGEKGPEMVVPAGKNMFSVIPTDQLKTLVDKVGGLMKRGVDTIKDRFDAPTEEEIQKKLQQTKEAEVIRDNILLQMEEQYGLEDMKRQAEMGLINDGGRYTDPDFVPPSQKYNMKLMESN